VPRLRINTVYYFRYWNHHQDPLPALYVLFSTPKHTWGLNIHYLGQIWNPRNWRFRRQNFFQTRDMLVRYRRHPAMNRFFRFLESDTFTRMDGRMRYRYLKAKWPKMIDVMFRQYHSSMIQVIWSIQKKHFQELTDPEAWRERNREDIEAYLEAMGEEGVT